MSRAVKKMNTFFALALKKVLSTEEAAASIIKEFRSHVQHSVPFMGKSEKEQPVARRARQSRDAIDVTASEAEGGPQPSCTVS